MTLHFYRVKAKYARLWNGIMPESVWLTPFKIQTHWNYRVTDKITNFRYLVSATCIHILHLSSIYRLFNRSNEFGLNLPTNWYYTQTQASQVLLVYFCRSFHVWVISNFEQTKIRIPSVCWRCKQITPKFVKFECVFNCTLHALAIIIIVGSRWICLNLHTNYALRCSLANKQRIVRWTFTFIVTHHCVKVANVDDNWWVTSERYNNNLAVQFDGTLWHRQDT